LVAAVLALAGALAVLFLPLATTATQEATLTEEGVGRMSVETDRTSLVEAQGFRAILITAIPVALAALTLPFRDGPSARVARGGAAGLLTIFFVLGLITIGIFFVPAAAVMWVAAFVR
jgi:hypothetical protein